jgi:hypothetical protein
LGRRFNDKATRKRRRRGFVWVLGVLALVAGLLYFEQVEIIYVLSVLGLSGFLLIVAFSDLDRGTRQAGVATADESEAAAAAGGRAAVTPPPVTRRGAKPRRSGAA